MQTFFSPGGNKGIGTTSKRTQNGLGTRKINSELVFKYSNKAETQGAEGGGKFAKMRDLKHCHRDLMRAFGWPEKAPKIKWIEVPSENGVKPHPVLCPIDVLEMLLKSNKPRFDLNVRGAAGDIPTFWDALKDHVVYTKIREHVDTIFSLILTMHGDGAPTNKVESLFTISWSSATGHGNTKDTRFVFAVAEKSDLVELILEKCT